MFSVYFSRHSVSTHTRTYTHTYSALCHLIFNLSIASLGMMRGSKHHIFSWYSTSTHTFTYTFALIQFLHTRTHTHIFYLCYLFLSINLSIASLCMVRGSKHHTFSWYSTSTHTFSYTHVLIHTLTYSFFCHLCTHSVSTDTHIHTHFLPINLSIASLLRMVRGRKQHTFSWHSASTHTLTYPLKYSLLCHFCTQSCSRLFYVRQRGKRHHIFAFYSTDTRFPHTSVF